MAERSEAFTVNDRCSLR